MGRKKRTEELDDTQPDAAFIHHQDKLKETWGPSAYSGGAEISRLLCLKVPFALELLFQQQGWPLGRFVTVVGPPETCKSAFGYEMCRLHRMQYGGYILIETEKKDSPDLRFSIVGYDQRLARVYYVESIEDWMKCLNENLTATKMMLDTSTTPPRSTPWCFLIDSILGSTTDSIGEKIDTDGYAGLVHPQAANIISTFMKKMNHWFSEYPFSVIGINHLKLGKDRFGNENVRGIQGGHAPRFAESLEIEMSRDKKLVDRKAPRREQGIRLGLMITKNSVAPRAFPIQVEMLWRMEKFVQGGKEVQIQRTWFDWGSSIIEYLIDPEDLDAGRKKELRSFLDLKASVSGRVVSSKALGIPEDEPLSFSEAGKLLDTKAELLERLRDVLEIRRRPVFEPGVDFHVQRERVAGSVINIEGDGVPPGKPGGSHGHTAVASAIPDEDVS